MLHIRILLFFFTLAVAGPVVPVQHATKIDCPAVWKDISKELTSLFITDGHCNDDARSAIRASMHDCFPGSSCDGSLLLGGELSRSENWLVGGAVVMLGGLSQKYEVGVADIIQFAAAHAIASCSRGPRVPTYVGRKDSCTPSPLNTLLGPGSSGDDSLKAFQARNFTAEDLAALVGAHTISRQFAVNPSKAGLSQDTTPDVWDTSFYTETLSRKAPFSLDSDINLSQQSLVGPFFGKFSKDRDAWDLSFSTAFSKLSLLGTVGANNLIDCTSALP